MTVELNGERPYVLSPLMSTMQKIGESTINIISKYDIIRYLTFSHRCLLFLFSSFFFSSFFIPIFPFLFSFHLFSSLLFSFHISSRFTSWQRTISAIRTHHLSRRCFTPRHRTSKHDNTKKKKSLLTKVRINLLLYFYYCLFLIVFSILYFYYCIFNIVFSLLYFHYCIFIIVFSLLYLHSS